MLGTGTRMLAKGWTVIDAAREFNSAFAALDHELPDRSLLGASLPKSLQHRYEAIAKTAMASTQKMGLRDVSTLFPQDPKVIYLQDIYSLNLNPPVSRKTLLEEKKQTTYEQTHARYHSFFTEYRNDLNVHDIFLIDSASGAVVYSTRKNLDFATNILGGPWKDTQLATVFKNVVNSAGGGIKLTDFEHYCLSDHLPIAFIAAPVRDGERTIAVLVLQLSVYEINAAMTDKKKWRTHGLGETGESYIVGPDYTMRNDSRFLLESRDTFFTQMKTQGIPAETLAEVKNDNTTILLLKVATSSVQRAFQGETGTALINDYRGIPVFSAFTPLGIPGVNWVLLAEIDQSEIFSTIVQLRQLVAFLILGTIFLVVVTGILLSSSLAKPINRLIAGVRKFDQSSLPARIEVTTGDEIGTLADAFNELAANLSLKSVSLNYFSTIINSMNEMLFVLAVDEEKQSTVITEVNRAALSKLDFEKGHLLGKTVEEFFLNKEREKIFSGEKLAGLLGKRTCPGIEEVFQSRTGEPIPVILSVSVMRNQGDSSLAGIVIIAQDISSLQKSEQELRRVNRALKTLSGCNQAVNSTRVDGDDTFLQNICKAVVLQGGYQLAWIGFVENNQDKTVRPVAQAGYDDGYLENLRVSWADDEWGGGPTGMAIKSGESQVVRHILTDSRYQPWRKQACQRGYQSAIALPLIDKALGVIGVLNIYAPESDAFDAAEIDLLGEIAIEIVNGLSSLRLMREHAKASEDLARSEERFRGIFEQAAVGISLVAPDGTWIMVNRKLCSLVGYSREELLQQRFQNITHPDDLDRDLNFVNQVLLGEIESYSLEKRFIRKDGLPLWINLTVSLVRDGQNNPKFFISVIEDISARKRAEAEQEKLVSIIEHSPEFVAISDIIGKMLYLNKAGRMLLGVAPSYKINDANVIDYLLPGEREHFKDEVFQRALDAGSGHGEFLFEHLESGKLLSVDLNVFPIFGNKEAGATGMAIIAHDLRERKESEDRLRQAQKMEAIGTLAGGIAHDFNNILAAILGFSQLAESETQEGTSIHEDLRQVIAASLRAKELVQQILTFSHKVDHALVRIEPHLIIKESLKLLRASLPSTIKIDANIKECGVILADPTQLQQIIMNLCTNAFHSMENENGVLGVRLERCMLEEKERGIAWGGSTGSCIELSVSDTGCGMAPETVNRIFEPYYTTKEKGKGTGLGLALVHGIVKEFGGIIRVESVLGSGTSFHVFFPCVDEVLAEKKEEQTDLVLTGNERILVVDDEIILVDLHKMSLEKLGYKVTGVTSSAEALAQFQEAPDSFDVIITDQTMPEMTGVDLAKKILQCKPDIPIIMCTGYSSVLGRKDAEEAGVTAILMKPVERKTLALQIRSVLDNR